MKDLYKKTIVDWAVENGAKREETEGVDSLAEYLAQKIPFYMAEREAEGFAKHEHTLQEWADYGYNSVVFENEVYYDGLTGGGNQIAEPDVMCRCYAIEEDNDGYRKILLERSENG